MRIEINGKVEITPFASLPGEMAVWVYGFWQCYAAWDAPCGKLRVTAGAMLEVDARAIERYLRDNPKEIAV